MLFISCCWKLIQKFLSLLNAHCICDEIPFHLAVFDINPVALLAKSCGRMVMACVRS